MAFTSHIFFRSGRLYVVLAGVAGVCTVLMAAILVQENGPPSAGADAFLASPAWREATLRASIGFAVMQGGTSSTPDSMAVFLADFRFAGTFFLYGPDGENPSLRRGVLSYLPENRQEIVSEGMSVGGARVKAIDEDRLVLEKDGQEGTLFLGGAAGAAQRSYLADASAIDAQAARHTRFGEQTGNGVWTMDKGALMDYYEELLEEPERLLQVFDSMRPLYSPDGDAIEGYVLQSVGERDFFEAVGFQEGDVVRRVNALPMTNRGRAEFFIRQVVEDRLSAVVIDIERAGGSRRLVYQLR